MKSFLEFYSQIKEDAMDAANPAMQAPQAPTMQNVRPAPAMAKRLPQAAPAGQQQQAGQAPTGQQDGNDPEQEQKLKSMLGSNYQFFVNALGANIKDPKFLNFLKAGLKDGKDAGDDKVNFSEISPKCSDLKPTQNEIDIDKSLSFPLKKTPAAVLTGYFKGGTHAPGGKIITCGGGKFIIDGHHRWSQLYCMNPNAQIEAIDLTDFSDPEMGLKVTQIAIATKLGSIPVQSVSGTNLINIDENTLRKYIAANISENAISAFSLLQKSTSSNQESNFEFILNYLKRLDEYLEEDQGTNPTIEFAHNHIWKNVQQMTANNAPVAPASKRDFMPQTDDAKGWDSALKSGEVNWKQECLVLSGLIIRD